MLKGLITSIERSGRHNVGRTALRGKASSKRGPRNFYKGRGARSLGRINSKGYFRYDPAKLPVFVAPDLTDCQLQPYVDINTPLLKVPPPRPPTLDLSQAEVDLLDIVAPQHKKLRKQKQEALLSDTQE